MWCVKKFVFGCSGIDPAALQVTNFFALYPVDAIVAATQMPAAWVGLLKVLPGIISVLGRVLHDQRSIWDDIFIIVVC